jgi:DNA modification methylase
MDNMKLDEIKKAIGVEPYHEEQAGVIYCADCLDILPKIPDKSIDLVLTDPPYGINLILNCDKAKGRKPYKFDRTVYGDNETFDPSPLLRFQNNKIIFGGNNFPQKLPIGGWIVWDKRVDMPSDDHSDAELAWQNIDRKIWVFRHRWRGYVKDGEPVEKYHPTQKPIELMRWCIVFTGNSNIILDPFGGSGTTFVAAKQLGRQCIMIEIEEKYCKIAVQRLQQEILL